MNDNPIFEEARRANRRDSLQLKINSGSNVMSSDLIWFLLDSGFKFSLSADEKTIEVNGLPLDFVSLAALRVTLRDGGLGEYIDAALDGAVVYAAHLRELEEKANV